MTTKKVKVDILARVEGEGGLYVRLKDRHVAELELRIFEPPRFFEAFLRGRKFTEVPDITARVCGICPVAYQMSACQAVEEAFGVCVEGALRSLRRLLYCGEWIESHALHIYALHAPDFLGYEGLVQMAQHDPDVARRGLRIKKIGNQLMRLLGGREIHPINVKVGGFYKAPPKEDVAALEEELKWALEASLETVRWVASFCFPSFARDYEFVALRGPGEYPMNEGRIVSNKGLDIAVREYERNFLEEHVEHSNALHAIVKDRGAYLVGPMARYALNFDLLSPAAQEAARSAGLGRACSNPFQSIIVRAVELVYACEEALRLVKRYEVPVRPFMEVEPRTSIGHGCTEAPRGILYHRYRFDERGLVLDAKIVPPTSQNQKSIEEDLRQFVEVNIDMPKDKLQWQCEQAIRNYDPCISCATHYLKLDLERE
jgi:coenzyme F420-reducing hydrogenase alpha subunit